MQLVLVIVGKAGEFLQGHGELVGPVDPRWLAALSCAWRREDKQTFGRLIGSQGPTNCRTGWRLNPLGILELWRYYGVTDVDVGYQCLVIWHRSP